VASPERKKTGITTERARGRPSGPHAAENFRNSSPSGHPRPPTSTFEDRRGRFATPRARNRPDDDANLGGRSPATPGALAEFRRERARGCRFRRETLLLRGGGRHPDVNFGFFFDKTSKRRETASANASLWANRSQRAFFGAIRSRSAPRRPFCLVREAVFGPYSTKN